MRSVAGHFASDKVPGFEVRRIFSELLGEAATLEVFAQVWNAAVVDVFVGAFEPPDFWIFGKVLFHVLVDELLKIEVELAEGADHDVGADPAFHRDVPVWILESNV